MKTIISKSEFKKTVKIYRSHNLKNNFISVTYAFINKNTVGISRTVEIENKGGALTSLYFEKCLKEF